MDQVNNVSKLAGSAGSLLVIVGLLVYLSAVFSFTSRMFVFVGIALIVLAFAAFFVQEFGPRR